MVDSDQSKLFVGGISRDTSEETLKDHFGKYGVVIGSVIARDRITGTPRGFGFVSFSDVSALDQALQDNHVILERTVEVKRAIPRSNQHQHQDKGSSRNSRSTVTEQDRTKKIFVGGLAPSLTGEEFRTYFEKFGRITDVVVMYDNVTNRPRGFGFITFDSEDAVEDVMQQNSFHELSGKRVEVKRAVPKEGSGSGHNGYSARVGNKRETFTNYQRGNHLSYSPGYGVQPSYGPFSGYGGAAGYPYGASLYGGGPYGFPTGVFGAMGYGYPWNSSAVLGIRGSHYPYGNVATVYPSYMNGGVGLRGMATNGYNDISGIGVNEGLSQLSISDAQKAADAMPAQIDRKTVSMNSMGMGGSVSTTANKV